MNKEIRSIGTIEFRANDEQESRTIFGCAVKFDSDSQDMGFIERIMPGSITEETISQSDVFARMDHRDDVVLARSRYGTGSLKLELREDGLYYEFEAPHTQFGDELLEHIKRGEISTSSFAFSLPIDDTACERWYRSGDVLRRDINRIDRLYDVSPVFEPAYLATSAQKRAIDKVEEIKQMDEKYDEMLKEIDEMSIENE